MFARSKVVHIVISIMKESTPNIVLGKVGIFDMKIKATLKRKKKESLMLRLCELGRNEDKRYGRVWITMWKVVLHDNTVVVFGVAALLDAPDTVLVSQLVKR